MLEFAFTETGVHTIRFDAPVWNPPYDDPIRRARISGGYWHTVLGTQVTNAAGKEILPFGGIIMECGERFGSNPPNTRVFMFPTDAATYSFSVDTPPIGVIFLFDACTLPRASDLPEDPNDPGWFGAGGFRSITHIKPGGGSPSVDAKITLTPTGGGPVVLSPMTKFPERIKVEAPPGFNGSIFLRMVRVPNTGGHVDSEHLAHTEGFIVANQENFVDMAIVSAASSGGLQWATGIDLGPGPGGAYSDIAVRTGPPGASGDYVLVASADEPCIEPGTLPIRIMLSNLMELPASPDGNYELIGSTAEHPSPNNHFGILEMGEQLIFAAIAVRTATEADPNLPDYILKINDMSLPWGGLFDQFGNWGRPHGGHRWGREADIRRNDVLGRSQRSLRRTIQKKLEDHFSSVDVHSPGKPNEHWHVTL